MRKVKTAYAALGFALAMTYILQFFNEMTPRALVVSFIPGLQFLATRWRFLHVLLAAWLMLCFRLKGAKDGALLSFVKLALEIVITIALAALFQLVIKQFFNVEPDEHIFKFLQAKFQIAQTDDFDAKLYLCNGAFNFMPWDTFPRLATRDCWRHLPLRLKLPIYFFVVCLFVYLVTLLKGFATCVGGGVDFGTTSALLSSNPSLVRGRKDGKTAAGSVYRVSRIGIQLDPFVRLLSSCSIDDADEISLDAACRHYRRSRRTAKSVECAQVEGRTIFRLRSPSRSLPLWHI